jgi:hypothetical protein
MAPKRTHAPETAALAPAEAPDLGEEGLLLFEGDADADAGAGAGRPPADAPAAADSLLSDEEDIEFEALQARPTPAAAALRPPASPARAPPRPALRGTI